MTGKLDAAYRIAATATELVIVLSIAAIVRCYFSFEEAEEMAKDVIVSFAFALEMFYASFAGCVISIILSICSAKGTKALFVVGRTLFMSVVFFIQASALKLVNAMYSVLRAFKKYDFETKADLRNAEAEDLGLTQSQIDTFEAVMSGSDSENGIVALALAIVFGAIVFFVLAIISIVRLVKKNQSIK